MKTKKLGALAVAATLAFCLLLTLPGAAWAQKRGGTLTVGLESEPQGFDAAVVGTGDGSTQTVALAIHDTLLWRDTTQGKLLPMVAASHAFTEDKKKLIFKIREGMKFHDGTPFTAHALVFFWNRILDPNSKNTIRPFMGPIQGVSAPDDHTFQFELKHPWLALFKNLGGANLTSAIPSPKALESGTQQRHPVGAGPFRFKSWTGGDRIVLERNPDYWDAEHVYLDQVVFRFLPDEQARYAGLKSGELDVIWTDRGISIEKAKSDPELTVLEKEGLGGTIYIMNTTKPPLDNPQVRQALAHAFNQEALRKVVYRNTRPFIRHPFGPESTCDSHYREHDPTRARALLAEYGQPVTLESLHTNNSRGQESAALIQQFFGDVGVQVKPVLFDQTTYFKKILTGDFVFSGWRIGDMAGIEPQLSALTHSQSSYNITRYKSPEIDKLLTEYRTADTEEKSDALGCQLIQRVNDAATMFFGTGNHYYVLTRKNVKNVQIAISNGVIRIAEAWKE